jgi:tRNA pseudouridine38-40 synthase
VKAIVEYDGGGYAGFQRQPHLPTIQAALESAVNGATQNDVAVIGAGRTDSSAHATGQVVAFTLDTRLGDEPLMRAVNAHLPNDIAIQSLSTVHDAFHPRFDAVTREYHYLVLNRAIASPLWNGRAYHVPYSLDIERMRRAACSLVGEHDFAAYASVSGETGRHTVRTLNYLDITIEADIVRFRFAGNAFMQHMIRTIVGTLLLVGDARAEVSHVREVLDSRDRANAAASVPAHGLYLIKVNYEAVDA